MSLINAETATIRDLRKFGITMAFMLLLISGIAVWKENWTAATILWTIAGVGFLLPALVFPAGLRPVFRYWMKFAFVLGWINQRVILSLVYYLVFTPISLIQRMIGRDPLERKPDSNQKTYWVDRSQEEYNPKHFERQF
ncbi:MAG: SxtJ family membrane protein [bacterium]